MSISKHFILATCTASDDSCGRGLGMRLVLCAQNPNCIVRQQKYGIIEPFLCVINFDYTVTSHHLFLHSKAVKAPYVLLHRPFAYASDPEMIHGMRTQNSFITPRHCALTWCSGDP